jgi:hypothetical protein
MRIYLASSWRNERYPAVLASLRADGWEVYDFREPRPGAHGFAWSAISPGWQRFTPDEFRAALEHPIAEAGFRSDARALAAADVCVLLLPCGRSAHLEAGWAAGAGILTCVLLAPGEPELMYKLTDYLFTELSELSAFLKRWEALRYRPVEEVA